MNKERKILKRAYAQLIAKELEEALEPKEIIEINNNKEEIRKKLLEYDLDQKLNIYREKEK